MTLKTGDVKLVKGLAVRVRIICERGSGYYCTVVESQDRIFRCGYKVQLSAGELV